MLDFCILTLHSETMLNSLIHSSNFVLILRTFYVHGCDIPANKDSFTSFAIYMPFFSLPYCTAISSTLLNSNCENRHPCIVPYHRRKTFSLSL